MSLCIVVKALHSSLRQNLEFIGCGQREGRKNIVSNPAMDRTLLTQFKRHLLREVISIPVKCRTDVAERRSLSGRLVSHLPTDRHCQADSFQPDLQLFIVYFVFFLVTSPSFFFCILLFLFFLFFFSINVFPKEQIPWCDLQQAQNKMLMFFVINLKTCLLQLFHCMERTKLFFGI